MKVKDFFYKTKIEPQVVHFLHIGKTGGTAIKYALNQYIETCNQPSIHLHKHPVRLWDIPQGEPFFFFLRDPVVRFVSGFYSRQRQGKPRYDSKWSGLERIAFDQFKTANELAAALSSSDIDRKESAESAMKNIYHVNSSYWDWFRDEEYFLSRLPDLFFVGFQETLNKDFETLKLKLNIPAHYKLPDDDVQAHRNPAYLYKKLNDNEMKNIRKWYSEEFRFLALCEDLFLKNPSLRYERNRITRFINNIFDLK